GFVFIPQVGQVFVSNLTLTQLRDVLYTRLGHVYSGVRRGANATTRFDISVANVRANQIFVVGEVAQPGAYQISSLGTVLTALYAAGGVTERANMRRIEVQRLGKPVAAARAPVGDGQGTSYRTPALGAPGIRVPALSLMDGDSVVVDFLPPLSETYYVAIAGRVNKPGRFPWRPGMTLRDLVQLARGPRVGAYLKEAEIARLPEDRSRGQLATTLRVPLDSTYLFERTQDGRF